MTHSRFPYVGLVLALLCTAGLHACSPDGAKGSVSVLATWVGVEEDQFETVLDAFTTKTGIHVNYEGTRAISQVLAANVQAGTPPDVAVLSSPGELAGYARNHQLYPLDGVLDPGRRAAFGSQWLLQLDNQIYTVPIKANLKSIIWYNQRRPPKSMPRTWQDLVNLARTSGGVAPWCMGMADAPSSGWPGSDMIEDILLHTSGVRSYQEWTAGTASWRTGPVKQAWLDWQAVWPSAFGAPASNVALFTNFGDAAKPMFASSPGCLLDHQASFIMGFYERYRGHPGPALEPGRDFDFFPFPTAPQAAGAPWEASADLAGIFNDTPQARELMKFLATDEAQQIWPRIAGSSAFTVDKQVRTDIYPDGVTKNIAKILSKGSLCLDAADVMPVTMRSAFYRAVLEYLNDPGLLDRLLDELEAVRHGIPTGEWLNLACS
jgi:alpha-glucoside transport system substrate-binding protein